MPLDFDYPREAWELLEQLDGYGDLPDPLHGVEHLQFHLRTSEPDDVEAWEYFCEKEGLIECVPWAGAFFYNLTAKGRLALRLRDQKRPSDPSKGGRPKKEKVSVNARMFDLIGKKPESKEWTASQFAGALGCSESSVKDTKVWKELDGVRRVARAEKQIQKARRRR